MSQIRFRLLFFNNFMMKFKTMILQNLTKLIFIFSFIFLFLSCEKEEPIPDKSIGEWQIYSLTDESGDLIDRKSVV